MTERVTLSPEQMQAVIKAFDEWLMTRRRWDRARLRDIYANGIDSFLTQLNADIWHSALLHRMLVLGKDPLPEPPPVRHAYPDYDAVESATPTEVSQP